MFQARGCPSVGAERPAPCSPSSSSTGRGTNVPTVNALLERLRVKLSLPFGASRVCMFDHLFRPAIAAVKPPAIGAATRRAAVIDGDHCPAVALFVIAKFERHTRLTSPSPALRSRTYATTSRVKAARGGHP